MKKIKLSIKTKKDFSAKKIVDFFIEAFYLLAIFSVPLFFSIFLQTENIFDLNKIFLLRVLFAIVLFLTIFRELIYPSKNFLKWVKAFKKHCLCPSVFIIALSLSLLFSTDIVYSFFGSIDRQLGYINYLLFFFWFLLLSFSLLRFAHEGKLNKAIKRILFTILFSAFLVSLYGALQFFGIDYFQWAEPAIITGRAFSSLGQPNFFASWLLLALPLSFWFFYKEKKHYLKHTYLIIFLFIFSGVIFSASRSALLSIAVLVFCLLLYYLFHSSSGKNFKKILYIFLFSVFVLLFSLFILEKTIPGRVKSLVDFSSGSVAARLEFYKTSFAGIKDKPFFGHGQENSYQSFLSHYDSSWIVHSGVDSVPDRSHNLVLDIVLWHGLFGLLFFIFFYFYIFNLFWKNIKKEGIGVSLVLGLGLILYLFSLFFNFSIVSTEFYLFTYLAILSVLNFSSNYNRSSLIEASKKEDQLAEVFEVVDKKNTKKRFLKIGIITASLFFSLGIIFFASNELLADYYFLEARKKFSQGEFSEALIFLEYNDELLINPVFKSFYSEKSAAWILNIYPYDEELVLNSFLTKRLQTSLENIRIKQPQGALIKARVLNALGDKDEADLLVTNFREKNPSYSQGMIVEAELRFSQGEPEKAINLYSSLMSNLPSLDNKNLNREHELSLRRLRVQIFMSMADLYLNQGNYKLAEEHYRLAYRENPLDHNLLKKLADILYLQKDFTRSLGEVKKGLRLSPDDYNWPLLAHYLYQELNEEALALDYYQQALDLGLQEN